MWRCPKCQLPLDMSLSSPACSAGHNFDRARQGYLNLLLANKKNSRAPGDSDAMLDARRAFLRAGFYQPLSDALVATVATLADKQTPMCIVDVGCGEGYYLEALWRGLTGTSVTAFGIDIAKGAVRRAAVAARALPSHALQYAVASSYDIPLVDDCADIVINIFAPFSPTEVKRVLKPGGRVLRVSPGPRHLYQLRAAIYNEVRAHEAPPNEPYLTLEEQQDISFLMSLRDRDTIERLLAMTPYKWHGDSTAKDAILEAERFDIEASFFLQTLLAKEDFENVHQ